MGAYKTTIKVSAAAAEYVGSYVHTDNAATDTEAFNKLKDEEKVSYIFEGDTAKKLAVYYKDQYGKSVPVTSAFNGTTGAKLENLTPTVAIVENNGTIKPISKGIAYVKVTLGEIVQTIAIEVKEDAAITTMQVAPEAVSVVAGQDATSKVTFKDQYGKEQTADAKAVTVKAKDEKVATATFADGKVTVKGLKEGSTIVTVTYKAGELELTKDIAVKVEKAGDLQEYKAVVKDTTLDAGNTVVQPNKDKAPKSTTITVDQIDSNGNKIGAVEAKDVKLVEVDKDGKDVAAGKELVTVNDAEVTANADKEGTAYVQVSVGSLVIDTVEIKVVNTKATATTAEFDRLDLLFKDGLKVAENGTVAKPIDLDEELKTIIKVLDQDGKVMESENVTLSFTTTNANGLEVDQNKITKVTNASATVDVVVTDVKAGEKSLIKSPVQVKVAVQVGEQEAGLERATFKEYTYGEVEAKIKGKSVVLQLTNENLVDVIPAGANFSISALDTKGNVLATNTAKLDITVKRVGDARYGTTTTFLYDTPDYDGLSWKTTAGKLTEQDTISKVKVEYTLNGVKYSKTVDATQHS